MKTRFLLLLSTAAIFCGCGPSSPSFTIDGETNAFGGKIYLQVLEGKTPVTIDSAIVTDGKFSFSGAIAMPMVAQLSDSTGKSLGLFFLENSAITLSVDSSSKPSLKIIGSREDSLFRSLQLLIDTVQTEASYMSTLSNFINSNPNSVAAAYTLFRQLSPYLESNQMRSYAATMDSSVRQSVYITKMLEKAALMDKTAVGQRFIDFEAADSIGNIVKLSSVAGQGNWVLLDFWASWCGPCRAENPHVVEAYNQFKDKGFTVFGVSLDKDANKWKAAIVKDGLNWTNVSDLKFWESQPAKLYGISSIPSNVLIAPDGTIEARNLRGKDLTDKLSEVLNNNAATKK